jgi:hypothetical protein
MTTAFGHAELTVGDRVFVEPHETAAPRAARGCAGVIVTIDGAVAAVDTADNEPRRLWIPTTALRLERRRRRRKVDWSALRTSTYDYLER